MFNIIKLAEHEVCMRDGWAESDQHALREALESINLYGNQFLYTAISEKQLTRVRERGDYYAGKKNLVYCNSIQTGVTGDKEIRHTEEYDIFTYLNSKVSSSNGALIVIYHRDQLNDLTNGAYTFKDPAMKKKAVAAIVRILDY